MLRGSIAGRLARFVLTVAAAVLARGGTAAELAVCIDQASPSADADARFAAALAQAEGATLRVHAFDGRGRGDDDFSLHDFKELLGESCRLVVGFPHAADRAPLPRFLKATAPYARTGFVLVTRSDAAPASLASMPQGARVGVAYDTLPNAYFGRHPQLVREIFEDERDALAALREGRIAAAMLWRAAVARRLERSERADAFRLQPIGEPDSQWDLVALHRSDDAETGARFAAALAKLRASGELARVLGGYAEDAPPRVARAVRRPARPPTAQACDAKPKAPPALFTQAQAGEGKALYESKCAFCHAPDLSGRAGPALKGRFFAAPSHKYKVADIFAIVSQNMPATQPGSLSEDEYVRIMAYILQQNGYPAGTAELTFETAKSSKTPLRYYGD